MRRERPLSRGAVKKAEVARRVGEGITVSCATSLYSLGEEEEEEDKLVEYSWKLVRGGVEVGLFCPVQNPMETPTNRMQLSVCQRSALKSGN